MMVIFSAPKNKLLPSPDFCKLVKDIYAEFGFNDILFKFSTRPVKRFGSDDLWDKAEQALKKQQN
jgi:threonyl-tRNA synthetase